MNKINVYLLTILVSLATLSLYAQEGRRTINNNARGGDIFYHTIERGQTVYSIATMYGVSVDDLYKLNPGSRNVIKAGDVLQVPQQSLTSSVSKNDQYIYHTIQPKETLYALSQKYSIPATQIISENPGLSVATFSIGKIIRIPTAMKVGDSVAAAQPAGKQGGAEMLEYTVAPRETMYRLIRKFDTTNEELLRLNPALKDGVKAGMKILIPIKGEQVQTQPVVQAPPKMQNEREVNALLNQKWTSGPLDRIQVALLLPFMSDQLRPSANTARYVEYYEGLLVAVDSMRNMGFPIELSVYDTGGGTQKLTQILNDKGVRDADLIIGGVQDEQIKPIADFAQKNRIKYVIPFSSRNDDVLSNAQVFQINTPHSYLYAGAAKAGCELFKNDNVVILNIGDSEEQTEFINTVKAEMQFRKIPFKELTYSPETFVTDVELLFDPEKRNVIIPTSASLEAVNNIKSPLRMLAEVKVEEREPYQIALFGYPKWQTYSRECLEDFYALNTYIYSFFYADNLSNEVKDFYATYKDWYSKNLINTFPKYGILGFDTGMFFFSVMRKYGIDFENSLDKMQYKSLQTGFDFKRVNNWGGFINTNLFIVQYKNDNSVIRMPVR